MSQKGPSINEIPTDKCRVLLQTRLTVVLFMPNLVKQLVTACQGKLRRTAKVYLVARIRPFTHFLLLRNAGLISQSGDLLAVYEPSPFLGEIGVELRKRDCGKHKISCVGRAVVKFHLFPHISCDWTELCGPDLKQQNSIRRELSIYKSIYPQKSSDGKEWKSGRWGGNSSPRLEKKWRCWCDEMWSAELLMKFYQ